MNWYLVKLVFRVICGEGRHTAQFDEQLRLIRARDKEQALDKASQLGTKEQEVFINVKEEKVRWEFVNVSEVYRLSNLVDGAELYSRIEEKEDGLAYQQIIHRKAAQLRKNTIAELLQLV